jgi:uncharacterized membrane protein YhhN
MIQTHLKFSLAYALMFVLVLVASFADWTLFIKVALPAANILLLLFLFITTRLKGRFHKRLFTGLIFSLAGNILLQLKDNHPSYLFYSITALFICQLFYIGAFYLDFRSAQELDKRGARIAIVSSAASAIAFYFYLRPHLGIYRLPVMVDVFVIALLAMMAVFRNQRVNRLSFNLVFAGVLFFILFNVFLAYTHFIRPFQFAGPLIVLSYLTAQYLIVLGGIKRQLLHNEPAT